MTKTKMYILVPDDLPPGYEMVAVAHASLQCYLKFNGKASMSDWVTDSFRKVVCRITRDQFYKAAESELDHVITTESSLGGKEVAISFCPREEWPIEFKYYPLWK